MLQVRIMGLDLGQTRIGVALSDELLLTAQGIAVLKSEGPTRDLAKIAELVKKNAVRCLVIGLPLNMDGSRGVMAEKAAEFGRLMSERMPELEVRLWDERLTTAAAQKMLVSADVSRGKRRQVVDKVAATLILQGYLDSLFQKRS